MKCETRGAATGGQGRRARLERRLREYGENLPSGNFALHSVPFDHSVCGTIAFQPFPTVAAVGISTQNCLVGEFGINIESTLTLEL